ncbi:ABC transporter permease [Roseivirga sp. E12]|uniref:ABC transporter permease n=1 Tax=Roseivirga sp. E12 TaxID=2819237 RepID=UPI001ABD0D9E|nr:ABC transporter permease [Roseivirga sp. E12]MBO3697457.1 ABC transporter permease [Roseivirga sp. E12]
MNKYLKSAYRNLIKKRLFSFVNITSLTFGLVCALFIGTYVIYEFSYDQDIDDVERVFRVNNVYKGSQISVIVQTAIKPYLDAQVDQVELATRVQRTGPIVFKVGDLLIRERNGYYADPAILDILSFDLKLGSVNNALKQKQSILISESLSEKYFAGQNPLGKEIQIDEYVDGQPMKLLVGGVFKDVPANRHLRPDYLMSIDILGGFQNRPIDQEWGNSNCFTYVKLIDGVSADQINSQIANIVVENSEYDMTGSVLHLQPLRDIHMQNFVTFGDIPGKVSKQNMFILAGIGLLIVLLVCINFFNMSTARSLERAKEIGVRKSIGASRGNVMTQFMTESALQVTVGMVLSIILFEVLGDLLASFTGLSFNIGTMVESLGYLNFSLFIVSLWAILVVGSGFYPALIISKFKPVDSLKGKVNVGRSSVSLSKVLLILQFTITLTIGVVAVVIYSQVNYMQTKDPGFQRDAVVSVDIFDNKVKGPFVEELNQNPLIESVTFTDSNVIQVFNSSTGYSWLGKPKEEDIRIYHMSIDENFIASMNISLIEGRNFDLELTTDKSAVILNEAAAKVMGIESLETLPKVTSGSGEYERQLNVIGIVKNFQAGTLREKDKPMLMYQNPRRLFRAYIKLSETETASAIASIGSAWNSLIPDQPFEYNSLNEGYERILAKDKASGNTLLFFTIVSVAISFFGLFGMTSLNIQSRMKELGIRKILGAHYKDIFSAVSRQFKYTMLIALVIGVPLAWYLGNQWLNEFAHRINITTSIPLLVVSGMAVVGLITIYFCTQKFTRINPVQTLREQ